MASLSPTGHVFEVSEDVVLAGKGGATKPRREGVVVGATVVVDTAEGVKKWRLKG